MKEQNENEMIDERVEFLEKWLISASAHESRDSENFISKFIHLVETDRKTEELLIKNLVGLLQSHQSNLDRIFEYCLNKKSPAYTRQLCTFIKLCLDEKNELSLSWSMQKYLLNNLYKPHMKQITLACKCPQLKIIEYLSLKMRSLDKEIRYETVKALYDILEHVQQERKQGMKSGMLGALQQALPQMIEKENYGKKVCYYRGVLLQVLEDEFCHIKKKGIELLGKAQQYLQPTAIRPLILYMLNDEHQAVRETCLTVLSQIPSLDIQKQDLAALLVCLKQNNTLMRSYTYENLSHINVTSAQDFRLIMQRLFVTLSNRNEDKKKIYIVCSKLGKKYPQFVLANLQYIYKFTDQEQPNWKSLIYRARFLTVASMGPENWPASLPKYFNSHYLYIRDVLLFVFEQKIEPAKLLTDLNQNLTRGDQGGDGDGDRGDGQICLESDWQLYQYVRATSYIVQGLIKAILDIILSWLQHQQQKTPSTTLLSLQKLPIQFNTHNSPTAKSILTQLESTIKNKSLSQLRELILRIRQPLVWKQLQNIQNIVFKISSTDRTRVVITNVGEIMGRSFIQFGNFGHGEVGRDGAAQVGYLRMSLVDYEEVNDKMCYFRINFKCKQIRCFILYGDPPQYHITQPYTPMSSSHDWLYNLAS